MDIILKHAATCQEAKRYIAAMETLGLKVTIKASGTWRDTRQELVFAYESPVLEVGARWVTMIVNNQTYKAEPLPDERPEDAGRISVEGRRP